MKIGLAFEAIRLARTRHTSQFGKNWHTVCIFMRLFADGMLNRAAAIGSPGIDELRWLKPVCAGDTDGSGMVDVVDLVNVILDWGCSGMPGECVGDVNEDGVVDVNDLIMVILNWGVCE